MCGRFTLRSSAELVAGEFLVILLEPLPPRYNIAPTQAILVVVGPSAHLQETEPSGKNHTEAASSHRAVHAPGAFLGQPTPASSDPSHRQLVWMQWGFRPGGRPAPETGSLLVNLRAESALQQPRFRSLLEAHRCLVLADGFYEWETLAGSRQPFFIHRKDDRPFGMAGLWKPPPPAQPWTLPSCVVLTTSANELVRPIHDRMPALLLPEHYSLWLDRAVTDPEKLAPALQPYPEELLEIYSVSLRVNSAEYDQPDCIARQDRPRQGRLFEMDPS